MKKITFILAIMAVSFGFSQELVTNGDFQTGPPADPWYSGGENNPIEVVDQGGGEFVFQANVTGATDAWRVNLSQVVALTDNASYELTFDAYTDSSTGTRPINVSLGQAAAPFAGTAPVFPTLTDTPQTFTYTFAANFDTNNGGSGSRVIFDMGDNTGFVFIDNVSLVEVVDSCNNGMMDGDETGVDCGGSCPNACPNPPSAPSTSPPNRAPADVVSVYSNAYTQAPTDGYQTFGSAVVTELDYSGNTILSVTTPDNGSGLQYQYFGTTPQYLDLSAMDNMHVDFYFEGTPTVAGTVFIVIAQYSNGTNIQKNFDVTALASNTWHEMDVAFADFDLNPGNARNEIQQVIVQVAGPDGSQVGPFYVDNLYFHNNTLGVNEFEASAFKVFPNPTNNDWNISSNSEITNISVYDILGKRVLALRPNSNEFSVDATSFNSGVYFAKIEGINGNKTIKLIKE